MIYHTEILCCNADINMVYEGLMLVIFLIRNVCDLWYLFKVKIVYSYQNIGRMRGESQQGNKRQRRDGDDPELMSSKGKR